MSFAALQQALAQPFALTHPPWPPSPIFFSRWASGNAGEMDFLEPGWNNPAMAASDYRRSFSTQNNQVGRCFQGGVNGGGFASQNYLLTEASPLKGAPPEPIVYVAVVDSVGNFVYRIPAAEAAALWPGLARKTAAAALPAAPARAPDSVNPGTTPYAGTFVSNCQARTWADARQQQCEFNGEQGFCVRGGGGCAAREDWLARSSLLSPLSSLLCAG